MNLTNLRKKNIGIVGHWTHAFGVGSATREMSRRTEGELFNVTKYDYEYFMDLVKTTNSLDDSHVLSKEVLLISALSCIHSLRLPQFENPEMKPTYVAYWWWETEEIPEYFLKKAEFFDEIWAPTTFIYKNLANVLGDKIVLAPFLAPFNDESEGLSRTDFQLPENTPVFLVKFDFFSSIDRKNPYAAIQAFRKAFKSETEAYLLIKTINGEFASHLLDELFSSVQDRSDIRVWNKNLSNATNNDLMKCVSGYVSLHRSEGLGLNILEAMQVKVPVIVTAYGGNMDFCDDSNSFLIPYKLIPVEDSSYIYPPIGLWAEPEIDAAAKAFTTVAQNDYTMYSRKNEAFNRVEILKDNQDFQIFVAKRIQELKGRGIQVSKTKKFYTLGLQKLLEFFKNIVIKSRGYLKIK